MNVAIRFFANISLHDVVILDPYFQKNTAFTVSTHIQSNKEYQGTEVIFRIYIPNQIFHTNVQNTAQQTIAEILIFLIY